MRREELTELNYITHIENLASICRIGILSKNQTKLKKVVYTSIAMEEVQARRKVKIVPWGRSLHDYVNLYFTARNPMLSKIRSQNENLCILRIKPDVLDIKNTIISDRNASADIARFAPSPGGLSIINKEKVFAVSWKYPNDPNKEREHKALKCAEVLVLNHVPNIFIFGAYVVNQTVETKLNLMLNEINNKLTVMFDNSLFF